MLAAKRRRLHGTMLVRADGILRRAPKGRGHFAAITIALMELDLCEPCRGHGRDASILAGTKRANSDVAIPVYEAIVAKQAEQERQRGPSVCPALRFLAAVGAERAIASTMVADTYFLQLLVCGDVSQ